MKKNNLTLIIALLLIGIFTSCRESKKINKQKIGSILKKEENNLTYRKPIVFIAGYDKNGSTFYDSARNYFKEKGHLIINEKYSLEEIIIWMNRNATKNPYGDVHIVNYSNPFKGMSLETVVNGDKITAQSLQKSITKENIPKLKKAITENTKIIFHSNGLGESEDLLKDLKHIFSTQKKPQIVASPYFNIFNGQFSNHYLAKPYYVFYPTANSPGMVDLSKEIARKYSKERDIDWFSSLTNETERYIGEPYTKRFNVPVKLEVDYLNSDNPIPTFVTQKEIINFIIDDENLIENVNKLNIPIKKFRWTYKIKNSTLIIKGKSSVLCVLKPITKPYGNLEHIKPDTNNKRLYAIK